MTLSVNQKQIMYKSLPYIYIYIYIYIYCYYYTNYICLNSLFKSEITVKQETGMVSITPFGVRQTLYQQVQASYLWYKYY
jgi:hypothetical protein